MNLLGNSSKSVSLLKDPFDKTKIAEIHTHFYTRFNEWSASVKFKNGMTEGTQNFRIEGVENFNIMLKQIQTFIDSL